MIKQTLPIKVVKLEGWSGHWKEPQKLENIWQTFQMTNVINLLKPTGYVMHQLLKIQKLYVLPTRYLCFTFIYEQTATCATYIINWLVFTTEMKSVYSIV